LISERPYKQPWPIERAFEYLVENRGSQFDANCVDAFCARRAEVFQFHARQIAVEAAAA